MVDRDVRARGWWAVLCALALVPASARTTHAEEPARYEVRASPIEVTSLKTSTADGAPFPSAGEQWIVGIVCTQGGSGRPGTCAVEPGTWRTSRAPLPRRLRECYRPGANVPLGPRRLAALRHLGDVPDHRLPAAVVDAFGPDAVIFAIRTVGSSTEPVYGKRPRCNEGQMDCTMVAPPIVGTRSVPFETWSWGWTGAPPALDADAPYLPQRATLTLLDPAVAGAHDPRALAIAARPAWDRTQLEKLAVEGRDAMVRFAAAIDAAVLATAAGDMPRANALSDLARRELDLAAKLDVAGGETLRKAMAALETHLASSRTSEDPCRPAARR